MLYRINDLKNFVITAKFSTISAAARNMGMTQPSLSQSLKRLELDLKIILFYRTKRGINLTPEGKLAYLKAQQALNSLAEIDSQYKHTTSFAGRIITIGCHPTVASYALPTALYLLKNKFSDFRFNIIHATSRNIQTSIQNGEIDFGIVVNPHKVPDIIIKQIATDEIAIWGKNKNTQSLNKIICNLDLFQTQSILSKWKSAPKEIVNSESFDLITRLTSRGLGLGIIPERAIELTQIKLYKHRKFPHYKDSICLVYRPEFGKRSFERELILCVTKALNE